MAMARKIRHLNKNPKSDKEKTQKTDKKEGEKGEDSPKKNQREQRERKPPSKLTFLDLPASMVGLSKEENVALSKKHYDTKQCKNCGNCNSTFPNHLNHECPFKMRAGFDWPEDHALATYQ